MNYKHIMHLCKFTRLGLKHMSTRAQVQHDNAWAKMHVIIQS